LHALPNQIAFDFLSQQHNKLCHLISHVMDLFLAGEDQQQTNQPNNQAGNQPLFVTCNLRPSILSRRSAEPEKKRTEKKNYASSLLA